jgi:hypothetical protein
MAAHRETGMKIPVCCYKINTWIDGRADVMHRYSDKVVGFCCNVVGVTVM